MFARTAPLFIVLLLLLVLAAPIAAQNVTPEPVGVDAPAVDGDIVVNDGGNLTIEAPAPEGAPLDALSLGVIVAFIVGGLLGAIAGGGSALTIISRIDKNTKDQAERLFESLSPSWQATILQVVSTADEAAKTARAAIDVLQQVTDRQPNSDPPASSMPPAL